MLKIRNVSNPAKRKRRPRRIREGKGDVSPNFSKAFNQAAPVVPITYDGQFAVSSVQCIQQVFLWNRLCLIEVGSPETQQVISKFLVGVEKIDQFPFRGSFRQKNTDFHRKFFLF